MVKIYYPMSRYSICLEKERILMAYFAVLHYVELTEPCLIEGVTCSVYDMTKAVLFREHKHRIQQTLHSISRPNQGGSTIRRNIKMPARCL